MDRFTAMKSPLGYYREWHTANREQLLKERLACVEISSPGKPEVNEQSLTGEAYGGQTV
jgi:hypothetical protein